MKVTNEEIFNGRDSLRLLSQMRLPVLVSLQVARLVSKLNEPVRILEGVRNSLVNQYGQRQESGEVTVVIPNDLLNRPVSPGWENFLKELGELMAQEIEVDAEKVKLPQEVDGKPLQIEPSILIALERLIEVEA